MLIQQLLQEGCRTFVSASDNLTVTFAASLSYDALTFVLFFMPFNAVHKLHSFCQCSVCQLKNLVHVFSHNCSTVFIAMSVH